MEEDATHARIPLSDFKCNICTDWLLEPQTTDCGHLFCAECIERWLEESDTCPICRHRCKTFPCLHVARQIDNLPEKCTHFNLCKHIGTRATILRHEAHCEFRMIQCPHCETRVRAKDLDKHIDNTVCRRYSRKPFRNLFVKLGPRTINVADGSISASSCAADLHLYTHFSGRCDESTFRKNVFFTYRAKMVYDTEKLGELYIEDGCTLIAHIRSVGTKDKKYED